MSCSIISTSTRKLLFHNKVQQSRLNLIKICSRSNGVSCQVERRVVTVTEIFVFKRFQPVLFGLFKFDPEMIRSVIDLMNLRYHWIIAAKKDTCEPVANNLVTANWLARFLDTLRPGEFVCHSSSSGCSPARMPHLQLWSLHGRHALIATTYS
jgi:hypothetical protein